MGTKHLELDYDRIMLGGGNGLGSPVTQKVFLKKKRSIITLCPGMLLCRYIGLARNIVSTTHNIYIAGVYFNFYNIYIYICHVWRHMYMTLAVGKEAGVYVFIYITKRGREKGGILTPLEPRTPPYTKSK